MLDIDPAHTNSESVMTPEKSVRKMSIRSAVAYIAIFSVIFASGAFYAGTTLVPQQAHSQPETAITSSSNNVAAFTASTTEEQATINAIKKVQPAVVSIVIKQSISTLNAQRNNNFFFIDPFTGNKLQPNQLNSPVATPAPNATPQEKEVGGGTGFIVSKDGYIITNKHVVSTKDASYSVFLNDGTEYKAKLLDTDPINDLGVLKIEGTNLPTVELGDSSAIEIGQTVLAIGNSLNEYRQTVSKGIVSGLNRTITASDGQGRGQESLEGIIQTDAAINPGNSGGPLVDLQGKVIGINTAIDRSGQSIGFALPINDAKFIVDSVKASGRVIRPQLGIRYMMLNSAIAKANQLTLEYGALVVRGDQPTDLAVLPGSPADKAGIVENDIILEINGEKLDEKNQLAKVIQKFKPGDTISLKVSHRGEEKTYAVTLTEQTK